MAAQRLGRATGYVVFAAAIAILAVLMAVSASSAVEEAPDDSGSLGTNAAAVPELDWGKCPERALAFVPRGQRGDYQCATVQVPLSYDDPEGPQIKLALGRLPAEGPGQKIGTLFWNPGGPGGSGRIPPPFSPALHERFDIVGFDPRGVAASTPVKCFSSNRQALQTLARPFPITDEQRERFFAANERGTDLCEQNAGEIISHVSTANVARDMDLLRQAVGDEEMTYLGFSYGTHLGEVYANLFPDKVRALALDAVLDPVEWTTGEQPGDQAKPFTYRLGSFEGSQDALESFLAECASATNCAFDEPGASAGDLLAKYEELLERLEDGSVTVRTRDGRIKITYQGVVNATTGSLYSADASPNLARFLEAVYNYTAPRTQSTPQEEQPVVDVPEVPVVPTFERPDSLRRKQPYFGIEWFNAVSCVDTANPDDQNAWPQYASEADEVAPGFGSLWTYASMPCATWPVEDADRYAGPWDNETANPILLIGNRRGDPATPYDDAQTTAGRLSDARLLTLNSFGHTAAYGGQSRCIDATVDRYLIQGTLPASGKVCQPNRQPFDPPQGASSEDDAPPEP